MDYATARNHMYGVNDGIGFEIMEGVIEGVYTGQTAIPDGTRTPGGDFNTEHSWPQSEGADVFPMRGDLHHIFPSNQTANSQRASLEFGETVCASTSCPWDNGGSERGTDGSFQVFQVRATRKGDIARAHFYFSVRYGMPIGPVEEATLRLWHDMDPPDARETARNAVIKELQGNRNPFVDQPDLVGRISDF